MPRVSRQEERCREYSPEITALASRTNNTPSHVYGIVTGWKKTTSERLAGEVSVLTGKPVSLYLVQKGVKIEAPVRTVAPSQDAYRMSRVAEETRLCDISDLDIVQLMREVAVLQAEIGIEMQRRMDNGKEG